MRCGSWQYQQTLTTHQLDADGKVVAKGTWKSIVRPGDPRPPEYIFKSMEGKLSFFESGSEDEGQAHRQIRQTEAENESELETNRAESAVAAVRKYKLRDRYQWKRLPDESMPAKRVYVLSFAPKPNKTRARAKSDSSVCSPARCG